MRTHRALGRTWVRACVLVVTAPIVFVGLFVVSGALIEDGHDGLGYPVAYLDWGSLVVAFFYGPAWVIGVLRLPTPPRNDGPPRGGIVPFPKRAPGDAGALDVDRECGEKAARAALHVRQLGRVWLAGRRTTARTTC